MNRDDGNDSGSKDDSLPTCDTTEPKNFVVVLTSGKMSKSLHSLPEFKQ